MGLTDVMFLLSSDSLVVESNEGLQESLPYRDGNGTCKGCWLREVLYSLSVSVCLSVCLSVCIYMYVCIYVSCMYVIMYVCMYVCMYECMHVNAYVQGCACMHV